MARGNGEPAKVSRPLTAAAAAWCWARGQRPWSLKSWNTPGLGATIYGEILAAASLAAAASHLIARRKVAMANVLRALLRDSASRPEEIDHLHWHGLSTRSCDAEEAQAIAEVFGDRAAVLPVVAAKSYFGNLGAASGMVELIASLLATRSGRLFPTLNYETPDAECPIHVVHDQDTPAGTRFIKLNVTPQGQASGLVVEGMPVAAFRPCRHQNTDHGRDDRQGLLRRQERV